MLVRNEVPGLTEGAHEPLLVRTCSGRYDLSKGVDAVYQFDWVRAARPDMMIVANQNSG